MDGRHEGYPGPVQRGRALGMLALRVARETTEPVTAIACVLSATGWTLMWAESLSLVHIMPAWLAAMCWAAGLGLIPFGRPAPQTVSTKAGPATTSMIDP